MPQAIHDSMFQPSTAFIAGAMPEPSLPPKTGAGCCVRHQRFDM